jgi:hypothetical protein
MYKDYFHGSVNVNESVLVHLCPQILNIFRAHKKYV